MFESFVKRFQKGREQQNVLVLMSDSHRAVVDYQIDESIPNKPELTITWTNGLRFFKETYLDLDNLDDKMSLVNFETWLSDSPLLRKITELFNESVTNRCIEYCTKYGVVFLNTEIEKIITLLNKVESDRKEYLRNQHFLIANQQLGLNLPVTNIVGEIFLELDDDKFHPCLISDGFINKTVAPDEPRKIVFPYVSIDLLTHASNWRFQPGVDFHYTPAMDFLLNDNELFVIDNLLTCVEQLKEKESPTNEN